MIFFVEAACGSDNMNWFVRATNPRQAFEFWCGSPFVKTVDPELKGVEWPVKVWLVPPEEGELGQLDWVYANAWEGRSAADFPESVESEGGVP